ncbi:MAG: Cof-type HAD-IIB family hydrolase [Phycisphaerae bacterium]
MLIRPRRTAAKPTVEPHAPRALPERIRLVAVDLDGTLLCSKKQITRRTGRAISAARERGVRVVIASARPPRSVRHIHKALGLDEWQINYNGALVWDEPANRAILHRPLRGRLTQEMITLARDQFEEVIVACEILDQWWTDRHDRSHTTETGKLFSPDHVVPVEAICRQDVTKLMLLGEPPVLHRIEPMIVQAFGQRVSVVHTDRDLLQIMDNRASKGTALRKVATHYGVPMEQTVVIGDAMNDLPMLAVAGYAIAMGNAHPAVQAAADWVAPDNDQEGVLAALQHCGLC